MERVSATVRVHRPTLTAEERKRRMQRIEDAAVHLVLATARAKRGEGA